MEMWVQNKHYTEQTARLSDATHGQVTLHLIMTWRS
jgi:hypothetical protein